MAKRDLIVAISCFVIYLVVMGTARLTSLYFVECMRRYHASRSEASFPFVLSYLMKTLSGPIIGVFGKKYGSKETTILGSLFCTLGIAACYLAEDIQTIVISWGLIFGLGFGFSTALLPLILTNLYPKQQTKVVGLALSGSCVGGIILPPVVEYFVDYYGTSGSFLLLAGIHIHCIPVAMLLRNGTCCESKSNTVFDDEKSRHSEEYNSSSSSRYISSSDKYDQTSIVQPNKETVLCKTASGESSEMKTNQSREYCDAPKESAYCASKFNSTPREKIISIHIIDKRNKNDDCLNKDIEKGQSPCLNFEKTIRKILQTFSVLANPVFIVICVIQSTFVFIMIVFTTILVDYVQDKNVFVNKEAYFVTILSAFDLIGHTTFGFITDSRYMSHINYTGLCFFLMAISFMVLSVSTTFVIVLLGVSLLGILFGATYVVFPAIINEFIKKNHQTMAMSCVNLLYAPLSFTTSPLIGYIRGTFGSYEYLIYLLAVVSVLCSCLSYLVPCFVKKKKPSVMHEEEITLTL